MITARIRPALRRLLGGRVLRLKRVTLEDIGADAASLVAAVCKTEMFCNAGAPLVRAMLDVMRVRPVRQGDLILRQGVRSDRFLVLVAGRAEVTRAREGGRMGKPLAVLNEPAGLGEETLLGAEIRSISVAMLTDGTVLEIRRADFARLISERGVQWMTCEAAEAAAQPPAAWLWAGTVKTRPRGMGSDVHTMPLERLRERLSELDPDRHYLCCGREDTNSALAAFLLTQRGFNASAVRDGRRVAARD